MDATTTGDELLGAAVEARGTRASLSAAAPWIVLLAADLAIIIAHWLWRDAAVGGSPHWFDLTRNPSVGRWLLSIQYLAAALLAIDAGRRAGRLRRMMPLAIGSALVALSFAAMTRAHIRFDLAGGDFTRRLSLSLFVIALLTLACRWLVARAATTLSRWMALLCLAANAASVVAGMLLWSSVAPALALLGASALIWCLVEISGLDGAARIPMAVLIAASAIVGVLHLGWRDVVVSGVWWFDLDRERNLGTWLSSAILAILALHAFAAYRRESTSSHAYQWPGLWVVVAALMTALSLDESVMFHENTRAVLDRFGVELGSLRYLVQWQVVLAPLVLAVFCYLAVFFVSRYASSRRALLFACAGLAIWLASQALEGVHPRFMAAGQAKYGMAVLIEEEAELLGAILLIASIRAWTSSPAPLKPRRMFTRAGAFGILGAAVLFAVAVWLVDALAIQQIVSPGQGGR